MYVYLKLTPRHSHGEHAPNPPAILSSPSAAAAAARTLATPRPPGHAGGAHGGGGPRGMPTVFPLPMCVNVKVEVPCGGCALAWR